MSNDLMISNSGALVVPAHLQGVNLGLTAELMKGQFTGGNRIGLKGSRFRQVVNGEEVGVYDENYLDVIFLGAGEAVSRIFYDGTYNAKEKNVPPTCYSADGIVPADDVHNKQSDKCALCPQNVKGSKVTDGNKYKACGYFRRLVVMLAGDTDARLVYRLDVKAQGLFGEKSADGLSQSLNDYIKMVANRGLDVGLVVTRISFDTNSSTPKLVFKAARFVTEEEMLAVQDLVVSDEVINLKKINMTTVDLSSEKTADELPEEAEQTPVQEEDYAEEEVVEEAPVRQAPQRPAQATQQRPATPAAQQRPATTTQAAKPAAATQAPARPAPQRPAAATQKPAVTSNNPVPTSQRPAQKTAAAAPVKQAPVVVEADSDDDLASILEGLE